MAIHFGHLFARRPDEKAVIEEAIRSIDPIGADASDVRWYVTGDEPQEGLQVFIAMKDDGSVVVTAFAAAMLARRILELGVGE